MTINILGMPFTVEEKECIDAPDAGVTQGLIIHSEGKILIRESLPKDLKRTVLIHEVVHGMLVLIGRNDLTEDESLVQTLAIAIDQTFQLKGDTSDE